MPHTLGTRPDQLIRVAIYENDHLAPLIEHYRRAVGEYTVLLEKSKRELSRARAAGEADVVDVWAAMVRGIRLRREGIAFFAEAFARPQTLRSPALQAKMTRMKDQQQVENDALQVKLTAVLQTRGFKRLADGQFEINC